MLWNWERGVAAAVGLPIVKTAGLETGRGIGRPFKYKLFKYKCKPQETGENKNKCHVQVQYKYGQGAAYTSLWGLTNTNIQVPFNHCDIFVVLVLCVTPLTFAASCGTAADELFINIFFFFLDFWLKYAEIRNE